MNKSKVLWVVFLGVLVVVLGVFVFRKNQDKAPVDKVGTTKQAYNPAEHFPNVSLEEDNEYHKVFVKGTELFYFERNDSDSTGVLATPNRTTTDNSFVRVDSMRNGWINLNLDEKIVLSLPNGFLIGGGGEGVTDFHIPLNNNRNIQISIAIYVGIKDCSNYNESSYDRTLTTLFPNKDRSIAYSAILNLKPAYREIGLDYRNQGLVFRINKVQKAKASDGPEFVTVYPCVQIFPNPEDPELKKNHPEIYPEVADIVKAIVEFIRPIE